MNKRPNEYIVANPHWFYYLIEPGKEIYVVLDKDTELNEEDPIWDFEYEPSKDYFNEKWLEECRVYWKRRYSSFGFKVYLGIPSDDGLYVYDCAKADAIDNILPETFKENSVRVEDME